MEFSIATYILLFGAALCIGSSKAGFGGMGMLALVTFAAVLPARESTGAVLPLLIVADVLAIIAYARHVIWKQVFVLMFPAATGVVVAYFLMPHIPDANFGTMIGFLILALVGLMLWMRMQPALQEYILKHSQVGTLMGFIAGVTTMLANAAGPVVSLYLLACKLPKMALVGTSAWYFFFLNLFKVPFSTSLGLIDARSLKLNLLLIPAVIIGFLAGRWLLGKVNQSLFEWLLVVFALTGAIRLIFW